MPQFKFPLQGVLRHRELTEQAKQRDLSVAMAERVRIEAELNQLSDGLRQANEELRTKHLVGKIDLNFLAAHRRYLMAMQRKEAAGKAVLAEASKREAAARAALTDAAKATATMETLRDHQRGRWAAEQDRREMSAADEVAMQMAAHGRAAEDERVEHPQRTPEVRP